MTASLAALCAVLAAAPGAEADEGGGVAAAPAAGTRWIATLGYDFAVGEPVEFRAADGSAVSLRLNGGVAATAGIAYAPSWSGPFELRATAGFKQGAAGSDGAGFRHRAFPIELLAAWRGRAVRAAAGLSVALWGSIRGRDALAEVDSTLDPSLGLVAQVEWAQLDPASRLGSSVGARAVWQTVKADGGGTVGASALGLFVGLSY